jgi:hypothetical protein
MEFLTKITSISLLLIVLTGCITTTGPKSTILLDNKKPIVFTFKQLSSEINEIKKSEITDAIAYEIAKHSKYKKKHYQNKKENEAYSSAKGMMIAIKENAINLVYVNGIKYNTQTNDTLTTITTRYNLLFSNKGDTTKVVVNPPSNYVLQTRKNKEFILIEPYLTQNKVQNDINLITSKLSPVLKRVKKSAGEFTVKSHTKTVKANFVKLLPEERTSVKNAFNMTKGNIYRVKKEGKEVQTKIHIYPYQDGTKIRYEFYDPYVLKGNGTTTYTSAENNEIINKIKLIANY